MNAKRIVAIIVIYGVACGGWLVLGATTAMRSTESHGRLGQEVEALWGAPLIQTPPSFSVQVPGSDHVRWIMPDKNGVKVELRTDYRKKGLIWYPTYTCAFRGEYAISNTEEVGQKIRIHFSFPAAGGTYDEFAAQVDDKTLLTPVSTTEGVDEIVELTPGQNSVFKVAYKTRGIREWRYGMDPNVGRVRNLDLTVTTDFTSVDYPDGCLSPMTTDSSPEGGLALAWKAADLITNEGIGITIPEKLNPGPLTARITFFAPVCLIFFFVLVGAINILYKVNIHPMHYLFVAAGFFAFHLLLAYMAGLVNIHVAFVISSVVSVTLVTAYLSTALKGALPWKMAAAAQTFFLVLFSYSFFLKGITGLTVAIGSVLTLAWLMKATAHVNWDDVFRKTGADAESKPPEPVIT